MTREKSHRFGEYGDTEGLRMYYQMNDWSAFVQKERDDATMQAGCFEFSDVHSIADMSAGGSHITPTIAAHHGVTDPLLGDLGQHYGYAYTGTLQETLPQLPIVDLYVCSETLEHLVDPDADLALIRQHTKNLLLTTPIAEEPATVSHGHLWTWRPEDVKEMLENAGFEVVKYIEVIDFFGVFICK